MIKSCVLSLMMLGTLAFGASSDSQMYVFETKEAMVNAPSPIYQGSTIGKLSFGTVHFTHEDGTPWFPIMGELHYSRIPEAFWEKQLTDMKKCGIEVIATYVFWNHHEEVEGAWNWAGQRNLRKFLELCKKHDLKVWVRIGPWCHGEARNGGWPDYIQDMQKARNRNLNPKYIARVHELYRQIAKQMEGLYYKNERGPVIGLQYDNEMPYASEKGYAYMKKLYAIGQEVGMDVPFHSATRWPEANPSAREFLTGIGGYPDAPWAQHTNKQSPRDVFTYRKLKPDAEVGNDYFTTSLKNMDQLDLIQPVMTVELGAGNQVCYHRRPFIRDIDCPAMAYAALGSGTNALGYYMFHGGVNPTSHHYPLNEARTSGYPNDCPVMNYDFQCPLGSEGQIRLSYFYYQRLHQAIKAIEKDVLTMPSILSKQAAKPHEANKLRCAYRGTDTAGFLIYSNVQRHVVEKDICDVQFQLKKQNGTTFVFPQKPVTIPRHAMGIWPVGYQVPRTDIVINYATGTLLNVQVVGTQTILTFGMDKGVDFEISGLPSNMKTTDATFSDNLYRVASTIRQNASLANEQLQIRVIPYIEPPIEPTFDPSLICEVTEVTPENADSMVVQDPKSIRITRQTWELKAIAGERRYQVKLPKALHGKNCMLVIEYDGDTAGLYQDSKMVNDDYAYGRQFLHRIEGRRNQDKDFVLQIVPLHPAQNIYFEDEFRATIPVPSTSHGTAKLKSVKVYAL